MAATPSKQLIQPASCPREETVDFTVVICTYNGSQRLPSVLEALRSQIGTEQIRWEILVIDNNSRDNTAAVVRSYQQTQPEHCPIHYAFEAQQGAGFARQQAVRIARSSLVGFLDDDNIPSPSWIAEAYAFGQSHPHAGAYGSRIDAQFEVTPPPNFRRIQAFLAITNLGSQPFLYQPRQRLLPSSAGLVVRQQAWLNSVPEQCLLTGRTKDSMLTGEDLEVLSYIQHNQWEIWHNPAMQISHQIPKWRLEREYLIPFMQGVGLSRHVTRMLSMKPWQRPVGVIGFMLSDFRKIVMHTVQYRGQIQTDLVAACEMQFFLSSLISPFYIWGKIYLDRQRN